MATVPGRARPVTLDGSDDDRAEYEREPRACWVASRCAGLGGDAAACVRCAIGPCS